MPFPLSIRQLETCIAACFYYSGLIQLVLNWKQRNTPSLVILNYHRATGGDLRSHLRYLRRHYRLLHLEPALEELYSSFKNTTRKKNRRLPLVLTFDDGYHDNYTTAFALAQELHVPLTIFLIPGYIESGQRFWWYEGEYLVAHTRKNEVTIEGRTYHLDTVDERKALAHAITTRLRTASSVVAREELLCFVRELLLEPGAVSHNEQDTRPLTWREVQTMEESEWISFGAHTMHHPILAYLQDPAEARDEVHESRTVLEQHLGHPVRCFAYPVGQLEHIGEQGLHAVQETGFDWAVTTIHGFNTPHTNPYLLQRIDVDVDQHWLMIAAKASGIWNFFARLFWSLVHLINK